MIFTECGEFYHSAQDITTVPNKTEKLANSLADGSSPRHYVISEIQHT